MKYWTVYFYKETKVATGIVSAPANWLVQRIERTLREKAGLSGPVLAEVMESLPEDAILFHELTDKK
ncbi:MAG: hypothetical protein EOO39_02260 [Cytophagaceae bacterium]|nr:MAG: hypothetical protein EOO39_02260 [Cytophagaceae bacterium]